MKKKINLKKILDKNLKIAKNDNITLTHKNELDFKNIPIIEDVVEFDKSKYKKPNVFYPIQHDKYLIPPIENFETNKIKNKIKVNPDMRIFKEMQMEKTNYMNKNKKADKFKTYANKLDDFVTSTNYQFNDDHNHKTLASFVETGLPKDFVKNGENSKTLDETNRHKEAVLEN